MKAGSESLSKGSVFRSVCVYILAAELCERLAYYGLTGSLSIFLAEQLGFESNTASEVTSTFAALCYSTPLLGGYLADTHLGRFRTIMFFCVIYVGGMALCTFAAWPSVNSRPVFLLGLFVGVALGTGGIKPNVVVLGAEQFDTTVPAQAAQLAEHHVEVRRSLVSTRINCSCVHQAHIL